VARPTINFGAAGVGEYYQANFELEGVNYVHQVVARHPDSDDELSLVMLPSGRFVTLSALELRGRVQHEDWLRAVEQHRQGGVRETKTRAFSPGSYRKVPA
jgi:hypothetical protein